MFCSTSDCRLWANGWSSSKSKQIFQNSKISTIWNSSSPKHFGQGMLKRCQLENQPGLDTHTSSTSCMPIDMRLQLPASPFFICNANNSIYPTGCVTHSKRSINGICDYEDRALRRATFWKKPQTQIGITELESNREQEQKSQLDARNWPHSTHSGAHIQDQIPTTSKANFWKGKHRATEADKL